MEEILFENCSLPSYASSPEYDAAHMMIVSSTFDKSLFKEIQNPSVVFTSCNLRGTVTSLHLQYADSSHPQCSGNFIIGVDGSYYQIQSLGTCRVGNTIYISSEGAVPSSAPAANDHGYNLSKAYVHKVLYDDYDVGSSTSCVGCGVIPNNGCYIGKMTQIKINGVDTIPIGVKYQGNIVLKCDYYYTDTGVVSPTTCATGPIVCRASNATKLYSKGYPVTTCSRLTDDAGFVYIPVYDSPYCQCFHCNPLIGWNCGAPSGFTVESASYMNGLNLAHYTACGYRPTISYSCVNVCVLYPDYMDTYRMCCCISCYSNGEAKHMICPAVGDIVPQCDCACYSVNYTVPCDGSYMYVYANRACRISSVCEATYSCSWEHNYVKRFYCENTSDAGAPVYASLSQIPVPLVYINVPISYRVDVGNIQSCIESGIIPIRGSDNNQMWSIRLPIVYANRMDLHYTDDPAEYWANVCSGQTWPYYCFQGYNYSTEWNCLQNFAMELQCCSWCCWYFNVECSYVHERIQVSDFWNMVRTLMDKYHLVIFEGASEHIIYQPYAMLSRKFCSDFINQEYMCSCNRYNLIQSISSEVPIFGYNDGLGAKCAEYSASCIKNYIDNLNYACIYNSIDCLLKHTCMCCVGLNLNNSNLYTNNSYYSQSKFKGNKFFEDMLCSNTAYIASAVFSTQCSCALMFPYCTIKNIEEQSGLDFNYTVHTPTTSILVGRAASNEEQGVPLRHSCYWGCVPAPFNVDTARDITNMTNVYWPGQGCYDHQCCYGFSIVQNPAIYTNYVVPALVCGHGVRKEFSWG